MFQPDLYLQATAENIRKYEARQEKEAVDHNQNVGREIDELYNQLGIDGKVNCMFQKPYPFEFQIFMCYDFYW